MENEKLEAVLKAFAALVVPHIMAHPDMVKALAFDPALIEDVVQAKMDELGPIDKEMVREVCEEVIDGYDIDSRINDYMSSNFEISDYEYEIKDMIDLDDMLEDRLPDAVATCVQQLRFSVEVSSC